MVAIRAFIILRCFFVLATCSKHNNERQTKVIIFMVWLVGTKNAKIVWGIHFMLLCCLYYNIYEDAAMYYIMYVIE